MERWNEQAVESLHLDASKDSASESEENFAIEEEDDDCGKGIDYAAIDGSGHL